MQKSTPRLALQAIEKEQSEKTGKLVLSDCGLTEIPSEVFGMDWLTELILTNSYPINNQNLKRARNLFQESNNLTYIPKEIGLLNNLKSLHLGATGSTPWSAKDIEALSELKALEELDLGNNHLTDLTPLQTLVNLKSLNLSLNDLKSGLEPISQLVNLEYLDLNYNQIEDLSALSRLRNLKELILEGNQIYDVAALHDLKKLEFLNLSFNKINDIDPLRSLTLIQELYLSSNGIQNIKAIYNLPQLVILDLSNNRINLSPKPNPFTKTKGLKELNLNNNGITDLTPLNRLGDLEKLHCSINQISDLSPLTNLINLQELYIDENRINAIEPLTKLPKLASIQLAVNPISDCPPDVWGTNDIKQIRAHFAGQTRDASIRQEQKQQQKQLEKLEQEQVALKQELEQKQQIKNRGLKSQEKETLKQVTEELKQKIEQTEKKLEEKQQQKQELDDFGISDVKLIFVGNSGAGKTQLSKFFESGKLDHARESTHGIRLKRWLPDGKVSHAFGGLKDKVAANIWDFGGQEYYHGTFRLFLSNYAVYVLMWETDTNRNDTLPTKVHGNETEVLQHYQYKYWLDNIRHYAPTSPVIILQNKIDKDERQRVDTEWIKDYDIFGDHYISLHEAVNGKEPKYKWSFDLFCNDLSACMQSILAQDINRQKSIAWLQVRDAVVNVATGGKGIDENPFSSSLHTGKFIRLKDFEKACLEIEPKLTESELYTLPRWLHNTGLVIYFSEHEKLSNKVYLDPSWVTEGIYKILNETVRAKDGVFTKADMKTRRGFRKDTVLALMEEMEIIFERQNETDKEPTFVAPQYLPETHPVEDLYAIAEKGLERKAFFIRLPLYFFRKVLQRMIFFYGMSKGVDARYYWKKGILFEKRGTRVMFKGILPVPGSKMFKGKDSETESKHGVFLIGAEPVQNYLEIQKEVFHIISEILEEQELSKIAEPTDTSDTEIVFYSKPSNWTSVYDKDAKSAPRWLRNLEVSVDGENFVEYLNLCKKNREKLVFIQSEKGHRLRIHDFGVLLDSKPQQPLKVFFSYSHKDTDFMNRLSVHLAPLRRNKKIEVWTDKAIQAGDEWDAEIKNNLRDSNIILLLVSADFVASSYIWEKEIPMVLKLEKESKARVIPIYLRPFDFSKLEFSKNQMVPKDTDGYLKAISQWENVDEAFMEIAKEIREVIESFN